MCNTTAVFLPQCGEFIFQVVFSSLFLYPHIFPYFLAFALNKSVMHKFGCGVSSFYSINSCKYFVCVCWYLTKNLNSSDSLWKKFHNQNDATKYKFLYLERIRTRCVLVSIWATTAFTTLCLLWYPIFDYA